MKNILFSVIMLSAFSLQGPDLYHSRSLSRYFGLSLLLRPGLPCVRNFIFKVALKSASDMPDLIRNPKKYVLNYWGPGECADYHMHNIDLHPNCYEAIIRKERAQQLDELVGEFESSQRYYDAYPDLIPLGYDLDFTYKKYLKLRKELEIDLDPELKDLKLRKELDKQSK